MTPVAAHLTRPFQQIDVFGAQAWRGNPVAVVLDGRGLSDAQMQRFANWTHLSETTFLLPPTDARADYRVRIFTPSEELPFAGHPTLGSCHAWLQAGGQPRQPGEVVQECAVGLVRLRLATPELGSEPGPEGQRTPAAAAAAPDAARRIAFAAPPLRRFELADEALCARLAAAVRLPASALVRAQWVDNGPGWVAVQLADAQTVRDVRVDAQALGELKLGLVGACPPDDPCQFEVRAFVGGPVCYEDPVTGSLQASLAQWLIGVGLAPSAYVARQGTALGREGRVHVQQVDGQVWVGGDCRTGIEGQVALRGDARP